MVVTLWGTWTTPEKFGKWTYKTVRAYYEQYRTSQETIVSADGAMIQAGGTVSLDVNSQINNGIANGTVANNASTGVSG